MSKLKNAPHLKEKWNSSAYELIVLIGSRAWEVWNKGNGIEWQMLADALQISPFKNSDNSTVGRYAQKPVIVDDKCLANIQSVRIATNESRYIRLIQCGELSEAQKSALCLNIATTTQADGAKLCDCHSLEVVEDFSKHIHKLRSDDRSREIAEIIAQKAQSDDLANNQDKKQPYIEKRYTGGISGLYRVMPKYDNSTGELLSEKEEWLCDVVEVVGIGKSENEDFLILEWQPEGEKEKIVEALPLEYLGEREGWKQLKRRGLKVSTKTYLRNELADFLQNQNANNRTLWTVTGATGWQNGAYILPNGEVIGTPQKPVLFCNQSATATGYDTKGTLESWQKEVAHFANLNPSMMLAVASALSAPIIHLLNAESFGVHLFGGSTAGKTTTQNIASSIYGNPEEIKLSWNATHLGLANEASARNDGFMPIDEIGQNTNKKHVETTAYTLFNGVGKIQGARDGGNRALSRWRTIAFSTGEIDLEGYLSGGGIKTNVGQLVRLLNIPIIQAKHYHGIKDGKAHADHLNQAVANNYGVVGRLWIEWLIEHKDEIAPYYQQIKNKWLNDLPSDASPQVQRVVSRFAILKTALHLSSHLTGWTKEASTEALLHCFNEWLSIFGLYSREEKQIIEQVNGWLLANAEGRFIMHPNNVNQGAVHNIAGYRVIQSNDEVEQFYVYPVAFDEAIKGHPKEQACKILADKGLLDKGESNYRYLRRLPHKIDSKRTRCYLLFPIIENDDEE